MSKRRRNLVDISKSKTSTQVLPMEFTPDNNIEIHIKQTTSPYEVA
jgi:hypothetical protein